MRHSGLKLFIIFFALFSTHSAGASQSLDFIVKNETFFKNLEYLDVDQFSEGRTFFGNLLKSYFRYVPLKRITIETGVLLGMPFGDDDRITPKEPIVSFHLDFSPGYRFTAGTLTREHPLLDAIFDDDLAYTDPIEQGSQLKVNTEHLKQDLWINWELKETPTRREKFSLGNFTQLQLHGFLLNGQLYWVHHGGQRNNDRPVSDSLSLAAGGGYSFYPEKWNENLRFIDEIGVMIHYLYNFHRPSEDANNSDGSGYMGKFFIRFFGNEFYYQQWSSSDHDFQPEKGDPLYKTMDYKEIGVEKSFLISDGINITMGFKGQWVEGTFVHIDFLSVTWYGSFSLFRNYFKTI